MGGSGAQQVESIGFGFSKSLFMPENYACRVVLDFAECNKSLSFDLRAAARNGERLAVSINGRIWILL